MKTCGACNVEKPLDEFSLKNGKPQWQCKKCHSDYRKNHYNANRQKYIDKAARIKKEYRKEYYDWLSSKSCVDCGNSDTRVLELDHLDNKRYTVGLRVGQVKLASLMEEINKCEVVCANCHRIRTITRGKWDKQDYAPLV